MRTTWNKIYSPADNLAESLRMFEQTHEGLKELRVIDISDSVEFPKQKVVTIESKRL